MTARAEALVVTCLTLAVALGPFTISQVWVHSHHHHHQSTIGPRAGEVRTP